MSWAANAFSVDLKGDIANETNKKAVEDGLSFNYVLSGGSAVTGAANRDQLTAIINGLPAAAKDGEYYWSIDLRSYSTLENWPTNATMSPTNQALEEASIRYMNLREVYSLANDALRTPEAYIEVTYQPLNIKKVSADVKPLMDELENSIKACLSGQTGISCSFGDLKKFDDLQFRYLLPVEKGAIQSEVDLENEMHELQSLNATIASDQQQLNNYMSCDQLLNPPPPPPGHSTISVPSNPPPPPPAWNSFLESCKKIAELDPLYGTNIGARSKNLAAALVVLRLRDLTSARCAIDSGSPLCLSEGDINFIERKITAFPVLECKYVEATVASLAGPTQAPGGQASSTSQANIAKLMGSAQAVANRSGSSCAGLAPNGNAATILPGAPNFVPILPTLAECQAGQAACPYFGPVNQQCTCYATDGKGHAVSATNGTSIAPTDVWWANVSPNYPGFVRAQ